MLFAWVCLWCLYNAKTMMLLNLAAASKTLSCPKPAWSYCCLVAMWTLIGVCCCVFLVWIRLDVDWTCMKFQNAVETLTISPDSMLNAVVCVLLNIIIAMLVWFVRFSIDDNMWIMICCCYMNITLSRIFLMFLPGLLLVNVSWPWLFVNAFVHDADCLQYPAAVLLSWYAQIFHG